MRRRLYFLLPTVTSARALLDELLLARITEGQMHFMAKEGTPLSDLPEASFLQKTDLVHGTEIGIGIGAVAGFIGGTLLVLYPPQGMVLQTVTVLIAVLVGAFFGGWASGLAAAAIPNSRLKAFQREIEDGQVLLIIDVAQGRVAEIEELCTRRHPEVKFGGVDPHVPVFP